MKKNRVVAITGMGLVSPLGSGLDSFYQRLIAGESGISPISSFPTEKYDTKFAGIVREFDTAGYINKKLVNRADPFISYTIVAGKRAVEDAGLMNYLPQLDLSRAGVLIGSGMGGMETFYSGASAMVRKGSCKTSPFFVPFIITNMGGALLAIDLGFKGPNYSISAACATANCAIISAANYIKSGEADIMLCGGTEAPIIPIGVAGFSSMHSLSKRNDDIKRASRPWDKSRDGLVMAEGSGVLVLEDYDHAINRGAHIRAIYLGGAISSDGYHMTQPREDGSGMAACILQALRQAGISHDQVDYINAHATGTPRGDICELIALRKVFGAHTKKIKINATKSILGHALGASGGIEAIATILSMERGILHPTINCEDPEDELLEFDAVLLNQQSANIKIALSTALGFGSHNAVVLFSRAPAL